jgi:outer membrane protein OmpA-like peptidoglycan-associated protein
MKFSLRQMTGGLILGATVIIVGVSTLTTQTTVGSDYTVGFSRGANFAEGDDLVFSQAASLLKSHPKLKAVITAYTEPGGDPAANQALSDQRASAAADALAADGVDAARITATGAGGSSPLPKTPDESDAEWQHRMARAEIRVTE